MQNGKPVQPTPIRGLHGQQWGVCSQTGEERWRLGSRDVPRPSSGLSTPFARRWLQLALTRFLLMQALCLGATQWQSVRGLWQPQHMTLEEKEGEPKRGNDGYNTVHSCQHSWWPNDLHCQDQSWLFQTEHTCKVKRSNSRSHIHPPVNLTPDLQHRGF